MSFTWKCRCLVAAWLTLAGVCATAFGNDTPNAEDPPRSAVPKVFEPIVLNVDPSPAPRPALKYRLLPLEPDRTPGDAAPIYLRVGLAMKDSARTEINEKWQNWFALPLEKFPVTEARKLIDPFRWKLEQIAYGARRQTCNWNYTLSEQRENAFAIQLPDVQEMRFWFRLLAIKARVEIIEKKEEDAIRTIETGLAFARHLDQGPFLISSLIGVACASVMLTEVDNFIVQPDAPNLYWALSALPRPLVGIRAALETEQKMGEWIIPEINEVNHPRTEGEWSALLARLHSRLMLLQKTSVAVGGAVTQVGQDTTLSQFRANLLTDAKAYFKDHKRSIEAMSDDQVLVRWIADRYQNLRDDRFKWAYLPYPEFAQHDLRTEEFKKEKGPLAILSEFIPAIFAVKVTEIRMDRKVAALRVIEAIRMHVATKENEGALPQSLDEIKIVPIPLDPMTGKAFSYHRDGEMAILHAPPPAGENQPSLTYRVTLKKRP